MSAAGTMTMHAKCGVEPSDIYHEGGELGFLLVHRLGGTPLDLDYVAGRLAEAGHTVFCPLLFGHGGSRALLGATTWQHWYGSVREAHDELKENCAKVIVGGLSAGTALALLLAAERQDAVDGLVLYAPTFRPGNWARTWYAPVLRRLGHKGLANLFRVEESAPFGIKDEALRRTSIERLDTVGRSHADVFGRTGGAMLEMHWLATGAGNRLAEVKQPALIFHAREDDRDRASNSYMLQQQLGGITDVVVLEDSYHLVTADRQRQFVVERTLEFASQIASGGPMTLEEGPL